VFRLRFFGFGRPPSEAVRSPSPAPARPLGRPKRLCFGALALVLAWVLLEAGSFILLWLATGQPDAMTALQKLRRLHELQFDPRNNDVVSEVHPYVGYVTEPASDSHIRRYADDHLMPVSEFGYIDEKLPFQVRRPDRLVVGITGGSVACFFGVNGTKRLEASLALDPGFAGKEFIFVNLAIAGYKQPQQAMTLAYLLSLGAEFDFIVNIDGFNEVALEEFANTDFETFPAFPRLWRARIVVDDRNLRLSRTKMLLIDADRATCSRLFSQPPWRYSPLANLLWVLWDRRLAYRSARAIDAFHAASHASPSYAATGPRRHFATTKERYDFLVQTWADSSVVMDRICKAYGMRYFHFLQPNQYVPGSKPILAAERKIAIYEGHPYSKGVERGYPLLIEKGETLRTKKVAFHDLTQLFAGHPEPLYADNCCHYNQAGYEIMAEAIARWIRSDTPAAAR
jgi:hypothetical protein